MRGAAYQNIDGLIDGTFGYDVLYASLVHVHGPAILEDSTCNMEVLWSVHLVGPIKEEVSCLISHS